MGTVLGMQDCAIPNAKYNWKKDERQNVKERFAGENGSPTAAIDSGWGIETRGSFA
jgi:hypothetical protein